MAIIELHTHTHTHVDVSSVLPVADYGSLIWYPIVTHGMKQVLLQVQRIAAQAVIKGFRTVALSMAEVEAGLVPLERKLRKRRFSEEYIYFHSRMRTPHYGAAAATFYSLIQWKVPSLNSGIHLERARTERAREILI